MVEGTAQEFVILAHDEADALTEEAALEVGAADETAAAVGVGAADP